MIDLADRRACAAWQPDGSGGGRGGPRLKEAALLDFGVSTASVSSWLYAKCHHQIPTTAVATAAVVATGDGTCLLLYNPEFFVAIGLERGASSSCSTRRGI